MISARERLLRSVLHEGLDDWVAVGFVMPIALRLGAPNEAAAIQWTIDVAVELSEQGLVRFGWIDRKTGWHYFEEPWATVIANLREAYSSDGRGHSDYYLWLELTPNGRAAAASLETEWERVVVDDAHRAHAAKECPK